MSVLQTGAVESTAFRSTSSIDSQVQFPYPLLGTIMKVYFKDELKNSKTGKPLVAQTVADVKLMGRYTSDLQRVPFSHPKANATTGEEWTPEIGDYVIVQFIGGNVGNPIITGMTFMPDNSVQGLKDDTTADKPRRYHHRCNKTDVVIDKDGNRTSYINGNETIEVANNMTVTVSTGDATYHINKGGLTINVNKSDLKISVQGNSTIVTSGNTSVNTYGNTEINTAGDTEINSSGELKLVSGAACTMTAIGDVDIMCKGDLTAVATGNAVVVAKKNLAASSSGIAKISAPNIQMLATGKMDIKTPLLSISGDVKTGGNIKAGYDVRDRLGTLDQLREEFNDHGHKETEEITSTPVQA